MSYTRFIVIKKYLWTACIRIRSAGVGAVQTPAHPFVGSSNSWRCWPKFIHIYHSRVGYSLHLLEGTPFWAKGSSSITFCAVIKKDAADPFCLREMPQILLTLNHSPSYHQLLNIKWRLKFSSVLFVTYVILRLKMVH